MNNRLDKEKGFISIFVLLVMVFLLVFVLVCFGSVSGRMKTEDIKDVELKEIYFERNNYSDVENYVYANEEDVIPIYNIMEFNRVGTGNSIQIKDMIYQCGISNHYLLKSDIWVDINEDILQKHVGFADFKLYSSLYTIDKANKNIFYYYPNEETGRNNWKAIAYQKFSEKDNTLVTNKTYLQNKFSIVNMIEYNKLEDYTFMIVWAGPDGALSNVEIMTQSNIPSRLEDIKVFSENYEYIDNSAGEFYVFVNL